MVLLNIGNTFTRISGGENGVVMGPDRVIRTAELTASDFPAGPVAAACVVPEVRGRLERKRKDIFWLSSSNAGTGVDFSQVDASTLGADRVANALALAELDPLPAICVDCGTAVTLELVDENRVFRGGAIAPGRMLMRRALFEGTAQLPEIPLTLEIPEKMGENTMESIRFGVDRGAFGMVRELVEAAVRYFRKSDGKVTVVFTGGDAAFFVSGWNGAVMAPETFTLTGLLIAAERREEK